MTERRVSHFEFNAEAFRAVVDALVSLPYREVVGIMKSVEQHAVAIFEKNDEDRAIEQHQRAHEVRRAIDEAPDAVVARICAEIAKSTTPEEAHAELAAGVEQLLTPVEPTDTED